MHQDAPIASRPSGYFDAVRTQIIYHLECPHKNCHWHTSCRIRVLVALLFKTPLNTHHSPKVGLGRVSHCLNLMQISSERIS
jgi:hypothetical protein